MAAEEPGLAEVLRRRREGCEELESTPSVSTADAVAAGTSASQGPAATVFESAPQGSIADVSAAGTAAQAPAATSWESAPQVSVADVSATGAAAQAQAATSWESAPQVSVADVSAAAASATVQSPAATSWESAPQVSAADVSATGSSAAAQGTGKTSFESVPSSSVADVAAADVTAAMRKTSSSAAAGMGEDMGKTRSVARSDKDLSSIMQARAARCEVLESTPISSTTDVQATVFANVNYPSVAPKATSTRTDADLQRWMSKMQGRVSVIQSKPEPPAPDSRDVGEEESQSVAGAAKEEAEEVRPKPEASELSLPIGADAEVGAVTVVSMDSADTPQSNLEKRNSLNFRYDALSMAASLPEQLEQLQRGEPLKPSQRERIWAEWLQVQASQSDGDAGEDGVPPALLSLLQRVQSAGSGDADLTLGSTAASGASAEQLAAAFAARRLPWLAGGEEGSTRLFEQLAKMLRYHCPSTAHIIETIAELSAADNLAVVLAAALGGAQGIADLLFASPLAGSESEDALLVLCDFAVLEEQDSLLLFVFIWLIAVASLEPEFTFEQLSAKLRGDTLGGLAARGALGVSQAVGGARAFLESTPASVREVGSRLPADITACAVSAEEVAHHVYGRPTSNWRLVVVDVRSGESPLALPVCMRLGTQQDRREVLLDLPYEESIHLVLLGDGPPAPGDEAFELYRYLTQPPARRRHLAVVAGGWPAVEACVRSRGFEFVQMEVKNEEVVEDDGGQDGLAEIKKQAAEKAAEIQKQAAVAGKKAAAAAETAAKAGEKAGRKLWKGMNRLVDRLDQHFATTEASAASGSGPTAQGAPAVQGTPAAQEAGQIKEKEGERRLVL